MWKQLFDWLMQVLRQNEETQRNRTEIKELRKVVDEVTDTMQRIVYAMQQLDEREKHEREKLELQLKHELEKQQLSMEIERLRAERGLPSAKTKDKNESE
ncbi:MAG: hypothetical protein AAB401_09555 [Acidobacteriota bacterium]